MNDIGHHYPHHHHHDRFHHDHHDHHHHSHDHHDAGKLVGLFGNPRSSNITKLPKSLQQIILMMITMFMMMMILHSIWHLTSYFAFDLTTELIPHPKSIHFGPMYVLIWTKTFYNLWIVMFRPGKGVRNNTTLSFYLLLVVGQIHMVIETKTYRFGQMHLAIWTNKFCNLNKYIWQLGQIHFAILARIIYNLEKYTL